jgi:hypothetical protein
MMVVLTKALVKKETGLLSGSGSKPNVVRVE